MNYHQILGVPANATDSDIKKAFRKKAKELHPDKNKAPDAAKKFQELLNAYEILINKKLKPRPHYAVKKPLTREEVRQQKIAEINLRRKKIFEKKLADFNLQSKYYTKSFYVTREIIFYSVTVMLISMVFVNRILFLSASEKTTGTIISFNNIEKKRRNFVSPNISNISYMYVYPMVEFTVNNNIYTIVSDIDNPNYKEGDLVEVIYKQSNPQEAYIYTFTHYWAKGFIHLIIPLFLVFAVSFSILAKGDKLQINIWPIKLRVEKANYLNRK